MEVSEDIIFRGIWNRCSTGQGHLTCMKSSRVNRDLEDGAGRNWVDSILWFVELKPLFFSRFVNAVSIS